MKTKYYLKLEIRYSVKTILEDEDDQDINYYTNIVHSDLFDTEKECIDFGNKLISANRWIEQYPGYQNLELNRRLGYPLVAPSLKNRADIYISVLSLKINNFEGLDEELKKFNIPKITKKL